MIPLVQYLLKVFLCSGLLYLYYQLALKDRAFHHWNRFYLLAAVLLSLTLPLLQFTLFPHKSEGLVYTVQSAENYLEAITVSAASPALTAEQTVFLSYALVSIGLLLALVVALWRIHKLLQRYSGQRLHNVRFVNTAEPGTPFSFLKTVFWNREISLQSETGQQIFQHELVHVKERHTLDKLFLQAVLILFWCNPFFWLIRRELSFVHEFIADKKAVGEKGTAALSAMILQAVYPQRYNSIVNPFFQQSIKRRLAMLTKIQNPALAYVGRVVALPVMAAVVFAFTVRADVKDETPLRLNTFVPVTDTLPKASKQVASVDVRKKEGQRQLTINYTDGSCETLTEQEANRRGLINNGGYASESRGLTTGDTARVEFRLKTSSPKPLVIVDGNEIAYELLSKLDPNKIEAINVLKNESAEALYGTKGKNGVLVITTKQSASDEKAILRLPDASFQLDSTNVKISPEGLQGSVIITPVTETSQEPVFQEAEVGASVDKQQWRNHLEKQLMSYIASAANKGMKPGTYVVNIRFLVEKDGGISDVKALNDPGYGLGAAAVKTVRIGPKWIPAQQNNRIVRSYHTQPITFQIQEQ